MQNIELSSNFPLSCLTLQKEKKRYNKVNEEIKQQFLSLIIQRNMTIKDASQMLNINYSSAKAILANHRKGISLLRRSVHLHIGQAQCQMLNLLDTHLSSMELVCSTGGKEVSRYNCSLKHKPIHNHTLILMGQRNDHQSYEPTESFRSSEI